MFNVIEVDRCIESYSLLDEINTSQSFSRWLGVDPGWGLENTFAQVIVQWMNGRMHVIHQEAHKEPLYGDMLHLINKLIQKYSLAKCSSISSAAEMSVHELAHQYGEYQRFEALKLEVLDRFKYTRMQKPANSTSSF